MDESTLTERQRKWFASVREGIERDTGRTIEQWTEIARTCPETKHRARLAWFKEQHGLAQNRASVILDAAFPQGMGWNEPDTLADTLWSDPTARQTFEALKARIMALPDVVSGQRKAFTAFSRKVQFAAARPKGSAVLLGLALPVESSPLLQPPGRASWSERLTAEAVLPDAAAITPDLMALVEAAAARS